MMLRDWQDDCPMRLARGQTRLRCRMRLHEYFKIVWFDVSVMLTRWLSCKLPAVLRFHISLRLAHTYMCNPTILEDPIKFNIHKSPFFLGHCQSKARSRFSIYRGLVLFKVRTRALLIYKDDFSKSQKRHVASASLILELTFSSAVLPETSHQHHSVASPSPPQRHPRERYDHRKRQQ